MAKRAYNRKYTDQLREQLVKCNMTVSELAEILKVNKGLISASVNAHRPIGPTLEQALIRVFPTWGDRWRD